jgi:Protein of unknown function (DUF1559)
MIEEASRKDAAGRNQPMYFDASSSPSIENAPIVRWRFHMTVGRLMKVIFAAGCLMGLVILWDRVISCKTPWHAMCANNLKQIGLALHNYHEAYSAFPPAFIADESGRPMHSWRVLILPYLEEQNLYADYDFNEPWNGPHNSKLLARMPWVFSCPYRDQKPTVRPSLTSYVVVSGPGTMFPGSESIRFEQVTDGSPNTLMVVETSNVQIPWTKPEDLDVRTMSLRINDEKRPSISSHHPGVAAVLLADGACRFLPESTRAAQMKSLVTIAGHETAVPDW